MKKALTIAGSDTSGGAGIQADLKTFHQLGIYGMSALTVLVTMDPGNNWSHQVHNIDPDIIKAQLKTIIEGVGIDALKTGMLPTANIIELVATTIKKYNLKKVVVDPVMVCKGAGEPLNPENTGCYLEFLVPLASVVTPNIFEASQLSGIKNIETIDDMKEAAHKIKETGAGVVIIKGGKSIDNDSSVDLIFDGKEFIILDYKEIETTNTHGAGCTFSAAITAQLAKGVGTIEAIRSAKEYVTEAIRNSFKLNDFIGTVNPRGSL
jgi:pyridoxine kinase